MNPSADGGDPSAFYRGKFNSSPTFEQYFAGKFRSSASENYWCSHQDIKHALAVIYIVLFNNSSAITAERFLKVLLVGPCKYPLGLWVIIGP